MVSSFVAGLKVAISSTTSPFSMRRTFCVDVGWGGGGGVGGRVGINVDEDGFGDGIGDDDEAVVVVDAVVGNVVDGADGVGDGESEVVEGGEGGAAEVGEEVDNVEHTSSTLLSMSFFR